ncbi:MAG: hypothetical protein ACYDC2_10435 [Solirubrobacteraceae bacterium]
MLTDTTIAITFAVAIMAALLGSRSDSLIARRPYNNVYSDAAAARRDHLG